MQKFKSNRPALLVLYYSRGVAQLPMRTAIEDHLLCWERHSRFPVIYHNYAFGFDWRVYEDLPLIGIVLDTLALNLKWDPSFFWSKSRALHAIRGFKGPKIAMPQDEFIHSDILCDFLVEIGATHIFSAGSPATARQLYSSRLPRARLHTKLTGYLEERTLQTITELAKAGTERSIDVGYRAWHAEPWLGEHGRLKVQVADKTVVAAADIPGLEIDVSTDDSDTFVGTGWYEFLLSCRTTLGVEGGASVLDRNGSIRARTNRFTKGNPSASFEDIRKACFANQDGSLKLFAIGPRHLEACATKTCQLLVDGEYQGILKAGKHYISIKRDFSNLTEVLRLVKRRDPVIAATAEAAFQRVVLSGTYSYASFVRNVEDTVLAPTLRRWFMPRISGQQRKAIADAIEAHSEIAAFALHEAQYLLRHRPHYEYSAAPEWVAEREAASRLAERRGITISPD